MSEEVKQALRVIETVCAKSVGDLQYHQTIERAMKIIVGALQVKEQQSEVSNDSPNS